MIFFIKTVAIELHPALKKCAGQEPDRSKTPATLSPQ